MSDSSKRDLLDHAIVRVPALATMVARGVQRIQPQSQLRQRVVELQAKRGFAAMARSDIEMVLLYYEPDAEVWMHGMAGVGVSDCYRGHDGVRALYADVDEVFSEWRWTLRALRDGGDRMAIRCDFRGHGRASGIDTDINDGGTAVRYSDMGRITWQAWFVEPGGWEKALRAADLPA